MSFQYTDFVFWSYLRGDDWHLPLSFPLSSPLSGGNWLHVFGSSSQTGQQRYVTKLNLICKNLFEGEEEKGNKYTNEVPIFSN